MHISLRFLRFLAVVILCSSTLRSQSLTWDPNQDVSGAQNGSGIWDTSNTNWWNGVSNTTWANALGAIADIGVIGTTTANGQSLSVVSDIQLAQLNFRAITLAASPTGTHQYTINGNQAGRILDFGTNGLIQVESGASGGSAFLSVGSNLRLKADNLRVQKFDTGTSMQFINLNMTTNPDLTGILTVGGSIYLGLSGGPGTLGNATKVVVEAGGSVIPGSSGTTYDKPFELAGMGNSLSFSGTAYGAIRMTGSNQVFSGGILLTADAGINTSSSGNVNSANNAITAPITDGGAGHAFYRFAFAGNGALLLQAANTYGGATVLGWQASNYTGSVTVLDFTAASSPQNNILYHGIATPGALNFFGAVSPSVMRLRGKVDESHSQHFGDLGVGGTHSALELEAGAGGSMSVSLGNISLTDATGGIVFQPGVGGVITSSMAEGFVGAFASYVSPLGQRSWARVTAGGVLGAGYAGDVPYATGQSLASYGAAENLGLTGSSTGAAVTVGTLTFLNTLSMADFTSDRVVETASGQTLRLGTRGGVQLVNGAGSLSLGLAGSFLSAGGSTTNTNGTLFLANHSPASTLTISSGITNNGTSAVTLVNSGAPGSRTVLAGAGTFTGGTRINSGMLVMSHANALGTSGNVTVVENSGALGLAGGITVARALGTSTYGISGSGDLGLGAIRSLSGSNTISGLITLSGNTASTTITAELGSTLTLSAASPTTNTITGGTSVLVLGGEGTIHVNGRLNLTSTSAVLTKIGSGLLVLAGDNTHPGATNINAGTLRLAHPNALAASSLITVAQGASLDVGGQPLARNITLHGAGAESAGALQNSSTTASTLTGTSVLGSAARVVNVGDITISNAGGLTGNFIMSKSGAGVLTFASATTTSARTGVNQVDAGTLRLQSANTTTALAPVGTGAFTLNGGTLALAFDISNAANTGAVNVLTSSGLTADRATTGAGGITHTLGALAIGGSTLTVSAGANVTSGTLGMTLGAVTMGGAGLIPGSPTFDVRSTSTAALTLTLGALHDLAIAPRTISFLNGGTAASTVFLSANTSSLVDGTVIQIGSAGGGPVNLIHNTATGLGSLSQVSVAAGSTLTLGVAPTAFGSLAGGGTVTGTFNLVVGNALNATNFNSVFDGVIATGASTFTKSGKSTLTLGGGSSNTFTGLTTVNAGTLILAKTGGAIAIPGSLTVGVGASSSQGPATVRLMANEQIASTATLILNGGSTLDLNGFTQTIGTTSTLFGTTIMGGGKLILPDTATSVFTGVSSVASGLQIGSSASATRTINLSASWDRTTISGIISQGNDAGLLIKSGNGQLILEAANTYTGLTTLSAGVLTIRHANALGSTGAGTVVSAGTLQLEGGITTAAEALTLSGGGFGGAAGFNIQNGALVNVSGTNTYAGPITLSAAATMASDSGTLVLSNASAITGAFTLTLTGAGDGRIESPLATDAGALTKTGTGTWTLTGTNTSTGTITVSNGTLRLGNGTSGSWTTTPALTFGGLGTFDYLSLNDGSSQNLGVLTFSTGHGTVQSTYGGAGSSALVFTSVTKSTGATGNFIASGGTNGSTNRITISGATANTFISQGLFFDGSSYAWNDTDGFVRAMVYGSDTGAVTSEGGASLSNTAHLQITGALTAQNSATFTTLKIAGDHNITLNASQTLTVNGLLKTDGSTGGSTIISGGTGSAIRAAASAELVFRTAGENDVITLLVPIIANATNAVTKSGPGLLVLGSGNTYTGATNISGGTLRFTAGGTLTTSGINVRIGGALDLNGQTITNGVTLLGTGPADGGALINSSGTAAQIGVITLGTNTSIGGSGDIISSGAMSGNSRLIKTGSGTLTLTVDSARTGPVILEGGIMRLQSAAAMGTASAQTVLNGGTLALASAATSAVYNLNVTSSSGLISDRPSGGDGVTYTLGTLAINSSTLIVAAGSNVTTAGTNAGITLSSILLVGSPTFDVRSPENASGGTTTLTMAAISDRGIARTLTFTNNGESTVNSQVILTANATSLLNGTIINLVSGAKAGVTLNLGGATAASNTLGLLAQVNVGAGSILNVNNGTPLLGGLSGDGTVTASAAFTLTIGSANSATPVDSVFNGALTNGAGTLTVTKGGLGTLTLTGNNTYTGNTTVAAGILKLGSATALSATGLVTVNAGGTLDLNGNSMDRNLSFNGTGHAGLGALMNTNATTTANLTGTTALGGAAKVGGAGNIIVNNATGLTGNVQLTKIGAGTLTFISSGASARSGANQIDEGTLRLQNTSALNVIGSGAMALNGGTLSLGFDSGGTVGGVVNLLSSSTIIVDRATPGDSSHTLTLGALGLGGGTLTLRAGANVTSGTAALTLGAATLGGLQLAAGNPTLDVQGNASADMALTLGTLSDQALAPRTITFQNSAAGNATVNLTANAISLLPGTVINLHAAPAATLTLNSPTATALGAFSQLHFSGAAALHLGASQSFASLNGSSGSISASTPVSLTLGQVPGGIPPDSVFNGSISGSGLSLVKTGESSLTLGGASTFGGGTILNAGTLILANTSGSATGSGPVTTLLGTTLGGSGGIVAAAGNSVIIGGRLSVGEGNAAGGLTITTTGAGLLRFEINSVLMLDLISGAGLGDNTASLASADLFIVHGRVSIMEGVSLSIGNANEMTQWAAGDTWRLFDWTGLSSPLDGGFDQVNLPTLTPGLYWDMSDLYAGGTLTIAVPEPGRVLMLGLGALFMLYRRRRS